MKTFSVDNQKSVSFYDITAYNDLTDYEINQLAFMNINDTIYIGIVGIKRLS